MKHFKKIISSVLVFALIGVPVASGTFANKSYSEEVMIQEQLLDQQAEKTEADSDKTKEKENNKKGMPTTKKVLIATSMVALIAVGCIIYNYCPAIHDFVNSQASTAKDFVANKTT